MHISITYIKYKYQYAVLLSVDSVMIFHCFSASNKIKVYRNESCFRFLKAKKKFGSSWLGIVKGTCISTLLGVY